MAAHHNISRKQFNPRVAVDAFPKTSAYDLAVASAMENTYDRGLREDDDDDGHAFWSSVHGEVVAQMDSGD